MINVTKTFLPDLQDYVKHLEKIWERGWITNNGSCVVELEKQLKSHLNVPELLFCNNGTIVLQLAIRGLGLKGDIITTPFSYVATTSSILWEGCRPVYADIDPVTFTVDPKAVEALITPSTTAILATHVYGNPCDVENLKTIADKHDLRLIYDAAHAFGVSYNGTNICNYGDVSTLSFHATKLFHTVEGGAMVTADKKLSDRLYLMRQFGHYGDDHFMLGLNGKVSEFHAAMGLCMLPKIMDIVEERKFISGWYDEFLQHPSLRRPVIRKGTDYNYAYYPVIFKSEAVLETICEVLKKEDIHPRRYFYPSLNTLPYITDRFSCPVSEEISRCVLSLPLFCGLEKETVLKISSIILKNL
jgi:dTDP-4-amino-4,6-dideoxygalactose transaminase